MALSLQLLYKVTNIVMFLKPVHYVCLCHLGYVVVFYT